MGPFSCSKFCLTVLLLCRTGEAPRPAALIQLAVQPGAGPPRVYLLHICACGVTPALQAVLCSPVRPPCDRRTQQAQDCRCQGTGAGG